MKIATAAVAVLLLFAAPLHAQNYGHFIGVVRAQLDPDGRNMTLIEPFAYIDPNGTRWEAPARSVTDGASIPRFAWSIIGGPFEGKYRNAAVIHDVACVARNRPWRSVHRAFYFAMLAGGVTPVQAKVMYAAVYHFGPRWATSECPGHRTACAQPNVVYPPPQTLTEADFQRLRTEITRREESERDNLTGPMALDDIERYGSK